MRRAPVDYAKILHLATKEPLEFAKMICGEARSLTQGVKDSSIKVDKACGTC